MIPKIVHYVWLGGKPLSALGERCLASWQKQLPGWKIRKWEESNSPTEHPFVKTMMKEGKFAFASDYIRLHALAEMGGVYFDTDMELLGDIRPILTHPCVLSFLSAQNRPSKNSAALGFLGAVPSHPWIQELRSLYGKLRKAVMNTTLTTESLQRHGLSRLRNEANDREFWDLGDIRIYHSDFFYPSADRKPVHPQLAVHHAEGSWSGQAAPLPLWQKLIDLRVDRKLLRPIEQIFKRGRS